MSLTFQNAIGNEQVASSNGGQLAGMRNRIINGDMRVAQRGTSFTSGVIGYSLDRWQFYRNSSGGGATAIQSITGAIPGNPGIVNVLSAQHNNGDTSTSVIVIATSLESINIRDLAGKTITLSFYAYCAGSTIGNTTANIQYGTGTDGSIGGGFVGRVVASSATVSSSGTWVKNTITTTLPSNATQLGISIYYSPIGTAGTGDVFAVSLVQLELGSVATSFEQRPYGMEYALCQRYYETTGGGTLAESVSFVPTRGDFASLNVRYQVTKRVIPTVTIYSQGSGTAGTVRQLDGTGSPANITATINSTVSEIINVVGTFQVGTHYGFNFTASAEL